MLENNLDNLTKECLYYHIPAKTEFPRLISGLKIECLSPREVSSVHGYFQDHHNVKVKVMFADKDTSHLKSKNIWIILYYRDHKPLKFRINHIDTTYVVQCPFYIEEQKPQQQSCPIPKTIFQNIQGQPQDKKLTLAQNTWSELNPDYHYCCFHNQGCEKFIQDNFPQDVVEAYQSLIPSKYKNDLWSYCVLYVYGGIYVDKNLTCKVPLDSILNSQDAFVGVRDIPQKRGMIWNGFVASIPQHPAIKNCIDLIVQHCKTHYYGDSDACDDSSVTPDNPVGIPIGCLTISGAGALGMSVNNYFGVPSHTTFVLGRQPAKQDVRLLELESYARIIDTKGNSVCTLSRSTEEYQSQYQVTYAWFTNGVYLERTLVPTYKQMIAPVYHNQTLIKLIQKKFPKFHHIYNPSMVFCKTVEGNLRSDKTTQFFCFRGDFGLCQGEGSNYQMDTILLELNQNKVPTTEPYLLTELPGFKIGDFGDGGAVKGILYTSGPEDTRLFVYRNQIWAVFNMIKEHRRSMFLYSFQEKRMVTLLLSESQETNLNVVEKNWSPLVFRRDGIEELRFVYGLSPVVCLSCNTDTGMCTVINKEVLPDLTDSSLRGGTPFVYYGEDTYISLAHQLINIQPALHSSLFGKYTYHRKDVIYLSRIVIIQGDGTILYLSDPISFTNGAVEFPTGIDRHPVTSEYHVTFGRNDSESFECNLGTLQDLVKKPQ